MARYPFTVVAVTDARPQWAYTVGLQKKANQSELCVSGLPISFAGHLLLHLGESVKQGRVLSPGEELQGIIRGHILRVRDVPRSSYESRFGQATRLLQRKDHRMLQLVWSSDDGRFPSPEAPFVSQELL